MKKVMKALAAIMLMTAVVFAAGCNKPDEPNNETVVTVTTITPSEITTTTAVCGAMVVVSEGVTLEELGVCWGLQANPTASEEHLSTAQWNEPFTCTLTELNHNTVYHVRAYAKQGSDYYYGADKTFTTEEKPSGNGTYNGHDYIDLGLPSGTLWATCNLGATEPEDYGDYFAWGEIQPKTTFNWSTYKYANGDYDQLTKYCTDARYGFSGFTDHLTTLLPEDDAATANWGSGWCIPTADQWQELYNNTDVAWTTLNGVKGSSFTASNGNSLFLPAAGYGWDNSIDNATYSGYCWSSSLYTSIPYGAWYCFFNSQDCLMGKTDRQVGRSVRAVCSAQ